VHSFWKSAGRALARHLTHLRLSLEDLTRRLKESVAATIGRVADEAAQEVVSVLLGSSASRQLPSRDDSRFWRDQRNNSNQFGYDSYSQEAWDDIEDDDLPDEYPEQTDPEQSGWQKALLTGRRAGASWLRRFERFPLLYVIGLGLLSGIASWVGGPLAQAGSGLAASAVTLADLASTLRSGSKVLSP
jgi:hypothetical protein